MNNLENLKNDVDLIIDIKTGKSYLLKDVKSGDVIEYTNDYEENKDYSKHKCKVLQDLSKESNLKAGNNINGKMVISADLGGADCLMVFLIK